MILVARINVCVEQCVYFHLTNIDLIICQGVTNEVKLERTESLGKLLHSQ